MLVSAASPFSSSSLLAICHEQKLDFYTRPACTQYEVFDLREFGLKYNTVALDNCNSIIVGHTSRLVTNVTFRASESNQFAFAIIQMFEGVGVPTTARREISRLRLRRRPTSLLIN